MTDSELESLLLDARREGDSRYTLRTSAVAFAKGAEFAINMLRHEIMANGLTEAETSATASVQGLTVKPWLRWHGGAYTGNGWDQVEVEFRSGSRDIDLAEDWYWHHDGDASDIIAYRVL